MPITYSPNTSRESTGLPFPVHQKVCRIQIYSTFPFQYPESLFSASQSLLTGFKKEVLSVILTSKRKLRLQAGYHTVIIGDHMDSPAYNPHGSPDYPLPAGGRNPSPPAASQAVGNGMPEAPVPASPGLHKNSIPSGLPSRTRTL